MGRATDAGSLWDRLPGRHRVLITNLLVLVVVAVAVGDAIVVIDAIRESGDQDMYAGPEGEESSRLLQLSFLLRYVSVPLGILSSVTVLAVLGIFVLAGHHTLRRQPLGWRRGVFVAALAATGMALAIAVLKVFLAVNVMTSVSKETREMYLGLADRATVVHGFIEPGVELTMGAVLIILGLAWWPRRPGERGLLDDDAEPEAELDEPIEPEQYAPPAPPVAAQSTLEETPEIRPRLRPDGSSDSGYDQFRFGR